MPPHHRTQSSVLSQWAQLGRCGPRVRRARPPGRRELASQPIENIAQRHLRQRTRTSCALHPAPSSTISLKDVSIEAVLIYDIFMHSVSVRDSWSVGIARHLHVRVKAAPFGAAPLARWPYMVHGGHISKAER